MLLLLHVRLQSDNVTPHSIVWCSIAIFYVHSCNVVYVYEFLR